MVDDLDFFETRIRKIDKDVEEGRYPPAIGGFRRGELAARFYEEDEEEEICPRCKEEED